MKTLLLPALLLALPTGPTASEAEPVQLAWRLPQGARYEIEASQSQTSTTAVMGQTQEDSQDQSTRYRVEVASVSEEGAMDLDVRILSMRMEQDSSAMTLSMTAERGEDGERHDVDVDIESKNPNMDVGPFESMMTKLGENLLDLKLAFTIDPQGTLLASSAEGDLFSNLPMEDETSEMILAMLEAQFAAEDLAQTMGSEFFFQLPADPVSTGATWSVDRSNNIGGMALTGEGDATLEKIEGEGDERVAVMTADLVYDVDTAAFVDQMENMMNAVYEQMEMDIQATVDLDADPFDVKRTCRFDVAGGYSRSVSFDEMRIPMDGFMEVAGQTVDMEIEAVVTHGSATWTRLTD